MGGLEKSFPPKLSKLAIRMIYTDILKKYNIDVSKLIRDYSIKPIYIDKCGQNSEIPTFNEFNYLYIDLNIPRKVLARFYGVKEHNIKLWARRYKISKSSILIHNNQIQFLKDNFGVSNISQIQHIQQLREKTFLSRYGCSNPGANQNVINKIKHTKLLKYGNPYYTNPSKARITRNKNKNSKGSKEEDIIYNILMTKFPDCVRWYCNDLRYPFECDFYIPNLDLFIEYQGYPSHGGEPFSNLPHQNDKINKWKSYYNKSNHKRNYNDWINVWTIKDPLKRKTAKDNNLNWIEFFNMKQFMEWYEQQ